MISIVLDISKDSRYKVVVSFSLMIGLLIVESFMFCEL